MALEAVRELLQHYLTMRFTMAFLTLWNSSVFCMAFCTGNLTVLARGLFDLVVHLAVASAADFVFGRLRIRDFQRIVSRMAC